MSSHPQEEDEGEISGEISPNNEVDVTFNPILCYSMKYALKEEDFFENHLYDIIGIFDEEGLALNEDFRDHLGELPLVKDLTVEIPCWKGRDFVGSIRSPLKSLVVWTSVYRNDENPCFCISRRVLRRVFNKDKLVLEIKKFERNESTSVIVCDPHFKRKVVKYSSVGFRLEAALTGRTIPSTKREFESSTKDYYVLSRVNIGDDFLLVSASIDAFLEGEKENYIEPVELTSIEKSLASRVRRLEKRLNEGRFQAFTIGGGYLTGVDLLKKEIRARIDLKFPHESFPEFSTNTWSGISITLKNTNWKYIDAFEDVLEEIKDDEQLGKRWGWEGFEGPIVNREKELTYFNIKGRRLSIGMRMEKEDSDGIGEKSRFYDKWIEFCEASNGKPLLLELVKIVKEFKSLPNEKKWCVSINPSKLEIKVDRTGKIGEEEERHNNRNNNFRRRGHDHGRGRYRGRGRWRGRRRRRR